VAPGSPVLPAPAGPLTPACSAGARSSGATSLRLAHFSAGWPRSVWTFQGWAHSYSPTCAAPAGPLRPAAGTRPRGHLALASTTRAPATCSRALWNQLSGSNQPTEGGRPTAMYIYALCRKWLCTQRPGAQDSWLLRNTRVWRGVWPAPRPRVLPPRLIRHCYGSHSNAPRIPDAYVKRPVFALLSEEALWLLFPLSGPFLPVRFERGAVRGADSYTSKCSGARRHFFAFFFLFSFFLLTCEMPSTLEWLLGSHGVPKEGAGQCEEEMESRDWPSGSTLAGPQSQRAARCCGGWFSSGVSWYSCSATPCPPAGVRWRGLAAGCKYRSSSWGEGWGRPAPAEAGDAEEA
jgi:hypothetical protein